MSSSLNKKVARVEIKLTRDEWKAFRSLRPVEGAAFAFWDRVARARDIDCRTIIYDGYKYTGLPNGHKKYWCWPIPLTCKIKPEDVEI